MSAYRSVHKGSVRFDGQDVAYELKRLNVEEAKGFKKLSEVEMVKFVRERVAHLDPINDADGNPVPIDTIYSDFYFSSLVSELADRLFQTGHIPAEKVDPSAGRSSAASPDGSRD